MTPEQIIEDYRAALAAVVGEEVAKHYGIQADGKEGIVIRCPIMFLDEGGQAQRMTVSRENVIHAALSYVIAATESLRGRAAEQAQPDLRAAAMRAIEQAGPQPEGALWGAPIVVDPNMKGGKAVFGDFSQGADAMATGRPMRPTPERLVEILRGTRLEGRVTQDGGAWWLRHDTADSTIKENEGLYHDIQQELERYGYRINEPQIEHDCISGFVVPIPDEDRIPKPLNPVLANDTPTASDGWVVIGIAGRPFGAMGAIVTAEALRDIAARQPGAYRFDEERQALLMRIPHFPYNQAQERFEHLRSISYTVQTNDTDAPLPPLVMPRYRPTVKPEDEQQIIFEEQRPGGYTWVYFGVFKDEEYYDTSSNPENWYRVPANHITWWSPRPGGEQP